MIRSLASNFRRFFSTEIPAKAPIKKNDLTRTGALGIKKGMMSYWDKWGKRHPVTILHVQSDKKGKFYS